MSSSGANMGSFVAVSPLLPVPPGGGSPMSFVTADSAAAPWPLGQRAIYGGEEYVWVHNAMSSAATAGIALCLSGLSGYSLTRSSVVADAIPICFVKHVDIPAGGYGWGLVQGVVQAHFSSTMVTGINVGIGTDGVVDTHLKGSFPTGVLVGRTLSSATANGQGLCYVKCYG
jgi:hypothetical protein